MPDGFGIYHALTYFFRGEGSNFAATWLRISNNKALENSILSCSFLALMVQFCARWAGKVQVEFDTCAKHPPHSVRIEYSMLFVDVVQGGGLDFYVVDDRWHAERNFRAAARLFAPERKVSWDQQIKWLKSPESEQYRTLIFGSVSIALVQADVEHLGR